MNHVTALFSIGLLSVFSLTDPCHAALIAQWSGDNTAVDVTGNGHNGVVNNATYASGVLGDAFSFDGTGGSVIVPADADLEPANLSISLWVQSALENHLRVLVDSTHGAGQAGWALQLNTANEVSFAYGNGSTFPEVTAAVGLGDGEYHHVAATLDGTTMRLYVDGGAPTTLAYSGIPTPSGRDIQIGNSLVLNRPLDGELDEIRIYDHVLSQAEVTRLASVPEPTTVGLFALAAISFTTKRSRHRS